MATVIVSSGNSPYDVLSGQTDNNDVVVSGGSMVVLSGGTASDITASSGGALVLASGGSLGGSIAFASPGTGGTLTIEGTSMPSAAINGFVEGDTIDLARVAFASGGSVTVLSGGALLQVVESGKTYDLNLASYIFEGESLVLSSDGGSGTDVTISFPVIYVSNGQIDVGDTLLAAAHDAEERS